MPQTNPHTTQITLPTRAAHARSVAEWARGRGAAPLAGRCDVDKQKLLQASAHDYYYY